MNLPVDHWCRRYLYLGLFTSEDSAAQAYDVAVLKIRGSNNCQTNFPYQQYLDDQGRLPADEYLDSSIAEIKAAAAKQLLMDLGHDINLAGVVSSSPEANSLHDAMALIKKQAGVRRFAGLEQEVWRLLSAVPEAAAQPESSYRLLAGPNCHSAAVCQNSQQAESDHWLQQPADQRIQSTEQDEVDVQANQCQPQDQACQPQMLGYTTFNQIAAAGTAVGCHALESWQQTFIKQQPKCSQTDFLIKLSSRVAEQAWPHPQEAEDFGELYDASLPYKDMVRIDSELPVQNSSVTADGDWVTDWLGSAPGDHWSDDAMLSEVHQLPEVIMSPAALVVDEADNLLTLTAGPAVSSGPVSSAGPSSAGQMHGSSEPLVILPRGSTASGDNLRQTANIGGAAAAAAGGGVGGNGGGADGAAAAATGTTVAACDNGGIMWQAPAPPLLDLLPEAWSRQMNSSLGDANGSTNLLANQPFTSVTVEGPVSCVSITWLQSKLPPHCQLQTAVHHTGGLIGVVYSQPCTAVQSGMLWGAAVWDRATFQHSQLCGTCHEATSWCCSVLQKLSC